MRKDFDGWNIKKKEVHYKGTPRFYYPREIWWCSLGINVGFEQDGKNTDFKRPVLIIKGLSKETCIIIPLTTSKFENKYTAGIGKIAGKESRAVLSQIRVIDTKRLLSKVGVLDREIFENIRKTIRNLF